MAVGGSPRQLWAGTQKMYLYEYHIQIKSRCEHCGEIFMARTMVTKYCSHRCNSRAYKLKQRQEKMKVARRRLGRKLVPRSICFAVKIHYCKLY